MRDWLRLANEAADCGNVIAALCFLEAEKENARMDHELEIADFRRQKEASREEDGSCTDCTISCGEVCQYAIPLSSDARLCESPTMVTQPLPERRPGG